MHSIRARSTCARQVRQVRAGTRAAAGRAAGSSPAGPPSPRRGPRSPPAAAAAARRARRGAPRSSSAMIIARIFGWRSSAMNMCSVRHRPMPSAPSSRALRASSGVSALARTPSRRISSAHSSTLLEVLVDRGLDQRHVVERDARPWCRRSRSGRPRADVVPPTRDRPRARGRSPARSAPTTAGRPMPRATSAACEALPPSEVRMPLAAWKPATSSASVNGRTRITSRPSLRGLRRPPAAVNTISPLAAPGEALTPRGEHLVSRPWGRRSGAAARRARSASIVAQRLARASAAPRRRRRRAKRTAACAGRLALRVWSM